MSRSSRLLVGAFSLLFLFSKADAQTITLDATDRGWYRDTGLHVPTITNWVAGWCQYLPPRDACSPVGFEFRNWFLFNLSPLSGRIVSATLRLDTRNYSSTDASETYTLFDVSTSPASLVAGAPAGSAAGIAIYDDLGSGISYGSRTYTAVDDFMVKDIVLNADGLAGIQGAAGGFFVLAGAVTSVSGAMIGDEFVFGGSDDFTPQLMIETVQSLLSALISDVVTLNIRAGVANSFDAKLAAAMAAIDDTRDQNDIAAINALHAFINAVEAQRGKQVTDVQATNLIASAQRIVASLGG